MTLADLVFISIVLLTLLGAVMAVSMKNVFHNALALILCLFGVACTFIYLNSEFLAVMEVIIYIGAIAIAIIFAIMLSQPMHKKDEAQSAAKTLRALAASVLLLAGIFLTLGRTQWNVAPVEGDYSLGAIGRSLLTNNLLVFETVSIILTIAIIGALVISSKEGSR